MILVEGCDGTGKTTLVEALSVDLGLKVASRGTANRDELFKVTRENTYQALGEAVKGNQPPKIWDRLGPISDPIYARATERTPAFKLAELKFCETMLKALRCPIIFCTVPLEIALENQEKTHQMEGVRDNFTYIHGMYENAINKWRDWMWEYDYRTDPYDALKEKVQHYIINRKDREWR